MVQEFKIDSRKEEFRIAKISPVELLAITTQIDFDKLEQTETLFKFALEHIEVKQGEKWLPVKTKDKEIYWPDKIDEDYQGLNDLITFFIREVVAKTFTKSRE